ncbi:MAG: hypothetical protein KGH98_01640 [Candidatus Micrarchaeota archaeon]|nr:hypothetical protein [Candidatus Micrarchaeota archaeon]
MDEQQQDTAQTQQPDADQQSQAAPAGGSHAKIIIVAIVVLVIAIGAVVYLKGQFSGSSSQQGVSGQLSPAEQLQAYSAKSMESHTFGISYQMDIPALAAAGASNLSLNYYELNNRTSKISMAIPSTYGASSSVAVYFLNGTATVCEQTAASSQPSCLSGLGSTSGLSLLTSSQTLSTFNGLPAGVPVSFAGTKTIAGRQCDFYVVSVSSKNLTQLEKVLSTSSLGNVSSSGLSVLSGYQNATFNIGACLDKEFGIPEQLNESITTYSKLAANTTTTQILNMVATNFTTNVQQLQFVLPAAPQNYSSHGGAVPSTSCISASAYLCINQRLNTSGDLSFTFGQNTGSVIYNAVISAAPSNSSIGTGGFPLTLSSSAPISTILPGQSFNVTIPLSSSVLPSKSVGTSFDGYLWLNYSATANGVSDIATKFATITIKVT